MPIPAPTDQAEIQAMANRLAAIEALIASGQIQILPEPPRKGPFFKVVTVPTVKCREKKSGDEVIINRSDFNASVYEMLEEAPLAEVEKTEPPAPEKLTRKRLSLMTLAKLKELPEFSKIEGHDKLLEKDKIIEAILAQQD